MRHSTCGYKKGPKLKWESLDWVEVKTLKIKSQIIVYNVTNIQEKGFVQFGTLHEFVLDGKQWVHHQTNSPLYTHRSNGYKSMDQAKESLR